MMVIPETSSTYYIWYQRFYVILYKGVIIAFWNSIEVNKYPRLTNLLIFFHRM